METRRSHRVPPGPSVVRAPLPIKPPGVQELITWIRTNGRKPLQLTQLKGPLTPEQDEERRYGKALCNLRAKAKAGSLADAIQSELEQVLPGWNEGLQQELIEWIRTNGRKPLKLVHPETPEEDEEKRLAKAFFRLRNKAKTGSLADGIASELEKVLPGWSAGEHVHHTPATAATAARELVEWCRLHHSNTFIRSRFTRVCDDEEGHKSWVPFWYTLRRASSGTTKRDLSEAFAILDEAFGPEQWRPHLVEDQVPSDVQEYSAEGTPEAKPQGQHGTRKRSRASTGKSRHDAAGQAMEVDSHTPTDGAAMAPLAPPLDAGSKTHEEGRKRPTPDRSGAPQYTRGRGSQALGFRLGEDQLEARATSSMHEVSAASATIDPAMQQFAWDQLAQRRQPVVMYNLGHELGSKAVGIEGEGYVRGAVFVLRPLIEDWMAQLSRPPPDHAHPSGGGEQPLLTQVQFRVEYQGYGPWRREFQEGSFMIVCLRCHPEAVEDESVVQQVIADLQDPQAMELLRIALCERKRVPFAGEFPIVGGADLQDVKALMPLVLDLLQEILGQSERLEDSRGLEAQEGELVRPIERGTATDEEPYQIVNAGKDVNWVFSLTTSSGVAIDSQCRRVVPCFLQCGEGRAMHQASDKIYPLGNIEEEVTDAARVSLSFLRAHGTWVKNAFGLLCDPRDRHDRDYFFSMSRLNIRFMGTSAGASYAVVMAMCFTGRKCKEQIYVIGSASISGDIMPVASYRDKMMTLGQRPAGESNNVTPTVLVPSRSVEDGILVEGDAIYMTERARQLGYLTIFKHQVRLPEDLQVRVLAVPDLFEALSLCLLPGKEVVPRPTGHVPGLAVTKAMVQNLGPAGAAVQLVEVFIYPGAGDILITAFAESTKNVAKVGLTYVTDSWDFMRKKFPLIVPRKSPRVKDYDLHVNMPPTQDVPAASAAVSWAVAAAYMSLLLGHAVPASVGFFAQCGIFGELSSPAVNVSVLKAARKHGIRSILSSTLSKGSNDTFLASCNEGDREGISVEYLDTAIETFNYIISHPDNINSEGLPPLQDGIQLLESVAPITATDDLVSDGPPGQQGGSEELGSVPSAAGTAATG